MDIEKWRVLLSALDCGSLAAAAQCNNYTTSGISRIIASLESEVGFKLLIRSRKGVKPTKECGLLLSEVRSLINSDETLSQKILRIKGFDTGTLTIGTSYSSSYGLLSDTVARFVKQYPNIKVSILWGYKSQLRQSVLSREIDIAVTTNQGEGSDKLLWLPLRKTRMVALVPSTHRMARRSSFPIDDFTKYPYIDINPDYESDSKEMLAATGIRPNTKYTTSDSMAALSLVQAGLGMTALIETQVPSGHERITVLPISPPQDIEMGLYFLRKPSLITNRFLSFIGRTMNEWK